MSQQQLQINLSQTSGIECSNCRNNTFSEVVILRKVSRFITGAANDSVMPIPVFTCTKCGVLCPDTMAPEVKDLFESEAQIVEEEPITPDQGSKIIQMPVR